MPLPKSVAFQPSKFSLDKVEWDGDIDIMKADYWGTLLYLQCHWIKNYKCMIFKF